VSAAAAEPEQRGGKPSTAGGSEDVLGEDGADDDACGEAGAAEDLRDDEHPQRAMVEIGTRGAPAGPRP
jgi:hypothetical protein